MRCWYEVHAAGVAIGDWLVMRGLPYPARMTYGLRKPKNRIPGFEVAGHVEAVGTNVKQLQPGDEVFGWCNGAMAEYVSVSEDALAPKPANLTFEQAAAVPISAFTALQGLRDQGQIEAGPEGLGQRCLGRRGYVRRADRQGIRSGSDRGVQHEERGPGSIHRRRPRHRLHPGRLHPEGQRYDLILDTVGNRSLSDTRRALTPRGSLVIVGGSGGPWLMGMGRSVRALMLSPFVRQRLRAFVSKPNTADLNVLKELTEDGRVTPVIDRTYPLGETREAIGHIGARHTRGKTVITV